jgi:hypothetical protein
LIAQIDKGFWLDVFHKPAILLTAAKGTWILD